MYKVAPLKSSFMLVAMLGFMVSVVYTAWGRLDSTWGFTLGLMFAIMFLAALRSMTLAPIDTQLEMAEGMIRKPGTRKRRAKNKKK
ncbi:hypothetical protein ACFL0V_00830 [Nanoarchaeota archaeon]